MVPLWMYLSSRRSLVLNLGVFGVLGAPQRRRDS